MVRLFEPLTLRGVEMPNHVFMSPMCLFLAPNGHPTDWHKVHYGARAVGGVGLVMVEATGILWPHAYRRGKFHPEGMKRHASRCVPDQRSDGAVVPHKADA
jgi:2,4-dienoyl-CoA reductase-like NADH-dependent reductase (Old Yellow Enzyme family)